MIPKLRSHIKTWPRWILFILIEGWPIVIILFALITEFKHIVDSSWLNLYLYNGDDLTLPVLSQALHSKEPFLWISSSQFLIFPEGLFYAISALVTRSVRAALVFNAGLNVVVLYSLLRWATASIDKVSRYFKQLYALGCCCLLIFYMLLEKQSIGTNSSSIATLFLFTTYYYGVVIAGVFLLCGLLKVKHYSSIRQSFRAHWLLVSASFLVAILSTFSDPLFIIQVTIPLAIALAVTYMCNALKIKHLLVAGLPIILGSLVGYVLRVPFKAFIGAPLGNHVDTGEIPATLTVFHQALVGDLHSKPGFLELLLVSTAIFYSLAYCLRWIYKKTRRRGKLSELDGKLFLLSVFIFVEVLVIIFFSIVIGSLVTRYLLPMFVFPLLGLLSILRFNSLERFKGVVTVAASLVMIAIIIMGFASLKQANNILSSSNYTDASCLRSALHNKPAYGLGSYWQVRELDIYGQPDEQALQVSINLRPFPWQANLGAYKNKQFTFVVASKHPHGNVREVPASDPYIPANPTSMVSCSDIYVYIYSAGSSGSILLNSWINQQYPRLLQARANGDFLQAL